MPINEIMDDEPITLYIKKSKKLIKNQIVPKVTNSK